MENTAPAGQRLHVEYWPIERLQPYEQNPRKNDKAVSRIRASIREFGFAVPVLATSDGEVIDGHLQLKGAIVEHLAQVSVIPCDSWADAQVKAFRLMVNRSVSWAEWNLEAQALEFRELEALEFDRSLTWFDARENDAFTFTRNAAENDIPPGPQVPTSHSGDPWRCGPRRVLCGDVTSPEAATRSRAAYSQSKARFQQASSAAAGTFLKLMVDRNAPAAVRRQAADLVFADGGKAIEIEDIDTRISELERARGIEGLQMLRPCGEIT